MRIFFLLILLLVFSCAKPNYIDSSSKQDRYSPAETTCPFYFTEERLCLSMKWTTLPSESEAGSFIMKFFAEENSTQPITPHLPVAVKLWMPSMGHGSSPVVIKQVAEGTYEVSDIYFIMLGEWEIRFQLNNNHDVIEEQIQKITI